MKRRLRQEVTTQTGKHLQRRRLRQEVTRRSRFTSHTNVTYVDQFIRTTDLADAVVRGRVEHGGAVFREADAVHIVRVRVYDERRLLSLNVVDVHGVVAAASDDLPAVGRKLDGEKAKMAGLRSARERDEVGIKYDQEDGRQGGMR